MENTPDQLDRSQISSSCSKCEMGRKVMHLQSLTLRSSNNAEYRKNHFSYIHHYCKTLGSDFKVRFNPFHTCYRRSLFSVAGPIWYVLQHLSSKLYCSVCFVTQNIHAQRNQWNTQGTLTIGDVPSEVDGLCRFSKQLLRCPFH